MIRIHTRVLNGLPVAVEADYANDRDEGVVIDGITVCWNKPSKLGQYRQAKVIEAKLSPEDWSQLEEELLEEFFYNAAWYA